MRSEYNNIYDDLFADYAYDFNNPRYRYVDYFPDEGALIRAARRAIDRADKEGRLRPDARYFLLVNIHQMLIKPLLAGRYPPYRLPNAFEGSIENAIATDVTSVIQNAIQAANEQYNQGPISGHQIINALNNVWGDLKTAAADVWG